MASLTHLHRSSLGSSPSSHLASILTCSNPTLNIACLANIQHNKIFERIRRSPHTLDELKQPLLGGLLLQSAMKSCLRTKFDFFFSNSSDEDSADLFSTQAYVHSEAKCSEWAVHRAIATGSNACLHSLNLHSHTLTSLAGTCRSWSAR